MLKKVLFSTFLFFMFGFNICGAERPLEFRENEDCHIIRLEQKGIGPHKFIHTGMNDNPFILEAIGSFLDYRALALTDIKGKTNELIDIEGHAFEITEYYAWYNEEQIKFWLVIGNRLPKYLSDLGMADGSGFLIESAKNHFDIFIIAPTKEGGYKVAFKLAPEDLYLSEPVQVPDKYNYYSYRNTASIKRFASINTFPTTLSIHRAKYNFDLAKWDAWKTLYEIEFDKENYELKIKKKEIHRCDEKGPMNW